MILASTLTLAQAVLAPPQAGPTGDESDPIVVVGERLRPIDVVIDTNPLNGTMKCRVTTPSGEERIDAAACEIALRCTQQNRRDRDRLDACVDAGYQAFLDDYFSDGSN